MSQIPWWGLSLIIVLSVLVGAVAAQLVLVHDRHQRLRQDRHEHWYAERKGAYVNLLASFERTIVRLRAGFAAGVTEPDPMRYVDDVGPALMQVRLLASAPVRGAALAVHLLLESMHDKRQVQRSDRHFLELLSHIPLVMHEFEVAVRDELDIRPVPPPAAPERGPGPWHQRARTLITRARRPEQAPKAALADAEAVSQDSA